MHGEKSGLYDEFVVISEGTFTMGSPASEPGRSDDEGPQHQVTVSAFELRKYPTTNAEYAQYLAANPTESKPATWESERHRHSLQPVQVTWQEAERFARWSNARLPTEAEWEYACRAGTTESRYGELSDIAWFTAGSFFARQWAILFGAPSDVGQKRPNAFGLYDMLGNMTQWCADWYGPYSSEPVSNPDGPANGENHVGRGGSWHDSPANHRAAHRTSVSDYLSYGIRLARS